MRLAALGLSHETNTFARLPATYDRFAETGILRGADIVRNFGESHATMAGYLDAGREPGVEVVPLLFTHTNPIGTITADAFERIVGEMLDLLQQNGPWDGVLLALHGAAVSEEFPDADGEIAARVRSAVGPDVPIGLSIDMHANISHTMIDSVTATVVYRTNPHLDPRPRARECADIIVRTIRRELRPVQALETPPVVINIVRQFTGEEPMRSLVRDAESVIARPGMLSASVAEGYPYADVAEMGMAFVAVHDGNLAAARDAARWMARRAWERRSEFVADTPSPREALSAAMAAERGPIVLMDVGDNIGGGSPGDSTILLETARRLGVRKYLQSLFDPEAVSACVAAGVGATLTLCVGGKTDDRHGRPVEVTGRVRLISDGRYEEPTPTHGGFRFFDGGTTVVLETTDEHTLLLTSRLDGNTSIQQMYSAGIRPETFQVVIAKGVVSPRPAYAPIAAQIVLVNTPGVTSSDLSLFTYRRRRRPLYPFEPEAQYSSEGAASYARSTDLYAAACDVLPGGASSNFRLGGQPVPLFFERGEGARLYDVDGNVYLDYALGMGPNILGHAPRVVLSAVADSLGRGQLFAGQYAEEAELARMVRQNVPCAEMVRFGSSGSEMNQAAIRVARAFTGRPGVVKFEGHYHGWFDTLLVSSAPPVDEAGPIDAPIPYLQSAGQSRAAAADVAVLSWNDLAIVERYLAEHAHQTAALLMEPILCNTSVILPRPGYLEDVRALCERYGVVLIFDEVITGFRVGPGGAQQRLGVTPDLAVFAKAMGAGFPIAALTGKRELMQLLGGAVMHGGTFNTHTVSTSASIAALTELTRDGGRAYHDMEERGTALMQGMRRLGARAHEPLLVQGLGMAFNTAFTDLPEITDYRSYQRTDLARQKQFLRALQDRGVRPTSRGTWFLSTAHSEADIDETLRAVEAALASLRGS